MAKANANGIQIEYETYGDRSGRPLLLIIGLGLQSIHWSEEVVNQLVNEGHFVIVFDNRDTGLSSKTDESKVPDFPSTVGAFMKGEKPKVPYSYYDMGDDAVGLLDALGIEKAHICGMSMGGAIAQTIAINHPSRVSSLTLVFAPTGNPSLPQPKPEIMGLFTAPMPVERNAVIDFHLKFNRIVSGSGFPVEEEWIRLVSGRSFDRSYYIPGFLCHLLASYASSRYKALPTIKAPTLVIHGDEDPLVLPEHGRYAAKVIPGAELMIIKGMGHFLPYRGPWPQIVEAITTHTKKIAT